MPARAASVAYTAMMTSITGIVASGQVWGRAWKTVSTVRVVGGKERLTFRSCGCFEGRRERKHSTYVVRARGWLPSRRA